LLKLHQILFAGYLWPAFDLPPFDGVAICYVLPDMDCDVSTQWPVIGDAKSAYRLHTDDTKSDSTGDNTGPWVECGVCDRNATIFFQKAYA